MESPLIVLNLTWAHHEVLSLYENKMAKLMGNFMKLSLKCKFGFDLYLKKSLTYLHLPTYIPKALFVVLAPTPLTLLADFKIPNQIQVSRFFELPAATYDLLSPANTCKYLLCRNRNALHCGQTLARPWSELQGHGGASISLAFALHRSPLKVSRCSLLKFSAASDLFERKKTKYATTL